MAERQGIRLIGEGQATVGVKEAAKLAGCSVKRMRSAIHRGEVRGEKRPGKYGEEWRIEKSSIPEGGFTLGGEGHTQGDRLGVEQALAVLREEARSAREEYGQAMVALGEARGELATTKALTERAESLAQKRAGEIELARAEVGNLRASLRHRTWAALLLLAGFAVAVGAVLR